MLLTDTTYLFIEAIIQLADLISTEYGLEMIHISEFRRHYDNPELELPLIRLNRNGVLWMDRYYLAYMLEGQPVRYIYLSKFHIDEEIQACKEVNYCRHSNLRLDPEIEEAFARAYKQMLLSNDSVWIMIDEASWLIPAFSENGMADWKFETNTRITAITKGTANRLSKGSQTEKAKER